MNTKIKIRFNNELFNSYLDKMHESGIRVEKIAGDLDSSLGAIRKWRLGLAAPSSTTLYQIIKIFKTIDTKLKMEDFIIRVEVPAK